MLQRSLCRITAGTVVGMGVLWGPVARAATFTFDQLFVFGDSLSDSGNVREVTGIPPFPYYQGRFSNGPNWVDYLADDLNLNPIRATEFGPGNASGGVNFAFGGATTGSTNTLNERDTPTTPLLGLQQQIGAFNSLVSSQQLTPNPNALYIVWAGGNDYLPTDGITSCPETGTCTQPTVPLQNLSQGLQSLVSNGAQNILLVNLPPLGELPSTRTRPESDALNQLADSHNQGLVSILPPGAQTSILDVNSLFQNVLQNPGNFGFNNVTDACLDSFTCLFNFDNQQSRYLFWDNLHPTTTTHRRIANIALANLPQPIPEPATVLGLATATSFLLLTKHRQRQNQRLSPSTERGGYFAIKAGSGLKP